MKAALFLAAIVIGAAIGLAVHFHQGNSYEVKIPARVHVSDYVGLNIDTDSLNFGTIPQEGYSDRYVAVNNSLGTKAKVQIFVEGDIKGMVVPGQESFVLERGESMKVKITASPSKIKPGNYTGTVRIRLSPG